jgi:hypothetical protein
LVETAEPTPAAKIGGSPPALARVRRAQASKRHASTTTTASPSPSREFLGMGGLGVESRFAPGGPLQ